MHIEAFFVGHWQSASQWILHIVSVNGWLIPDSRCPGSADRLWTVGHLNFTEHVLLIVLRYMLVLVLLDLVGD